MYSGVFLRLLNSDGEVLAESERIATGEKFYTRLAASVTLDSTQSIAAAVGICGEGVAYADAAQLEAGTNPSRYNLISNSSFESEFAGWDKSNCDECLSISNEAFIQGGSSLKMYDKDSRPIEIVQQIRPNSFANVVETFTLSTWFKGFIGASHVPAEISAKIHYKPGSSYSHSPEVHSQAVDIRTEDWQHVSMTFHKKRYKAIAYIEICLSEYSCDNPLLFDNIILTRDSIKTVQNEQEFKELYQTSATEEEETKVDDSDVVSKEDETSENFTEVLDEYGNPLTSTQFTGGLFGTYYRSYTYDENGNNVISETDERGNTTTYTVDEETSRITQSTDACGTKTLYEYDNAGRQTKVTSKAPDGTELSHVDYAYNSLDNLTRITRGDGETYGMSYNEFHKLAGVGLLDGEGNITPLTSYTYANATENLKPPPMPTDAP